MNCLCIQDEYPYYRSKLTGFLFTQTFLLTVTAMLASCTTSLSLCKSFSKNSFFLLSTTYNHLGVCFRCRSFNSTARHDKIEASFILFIWLIAFVFESECKGIAFFDTMQDFCKEKCNIYVVFNIYLHIKSLFVGAHIIYITRERGR